MNLTLQRADPTLTLRAIPKEFPPRTHYPLTNLGRDQGPRKPGDPPPLEKRIPKGPLSVTENHRVPLPLKILENSDAHVNPRFS